MHRRTIASFLIVLLLLILLPACGGDPSAPDSTEEPGFVIITATPRDTATPTVTPTPEVPPLDEIDLSGTEIELWYTLDPTSPDLIADLLAEFNQANEYGIVAAGQNLFYPNDLEDEMTAALENDSLPALALAEMYQYFSWFSAGKIIDLSPYLRSMPHESLEYMYLSAMNGLLPNNNPNMRWDFPGLLSAQVMLYNQSWAEDLGFNTTPETAADFQQQACAAHEANGDRTGGWMIDPSPEGASTWLLSFDSGLGQLLDFKSREVAEAYTFLSDLYTEGCAWTPLEQYPDEDFALRQGLFYAVDTREIGYVTEAFSLAESLDEWTAIGYPNPQGEPVISLTGSSYVIFESDAESQIASWLLIRYLTSQESQIKLTQGGLYLPLDRETATILQNMDALPPVWQQSLDLLDQAVKDPFPIWGILVPVLQDAQAEVMDDRFVPGTMSLFQDQLDKLVEDIISQ